MASVTHLLDKSAWVQAPTHPGAATRITELIRHGSLALSTITALEILYSARNSAEYQRDYARLVQLPWLDLSVPRRAVEVQRELAARGQHWTPIPDVIIAATAAEHDLVVLHYDSDYEQLAAACGARHEWIIDRASGHRSTRTDT